MVNAIVSSLVLCTALLAQSIMASPTPAADSVSVTLAADAQDGIYVVTFDGEHGYLGPHNETTVAALAARALSSNNNVDKRDDTGVHCNPNSQSMNRGDIVFSSSALAAWFVDNSCFKGKSLYSVRGNAVSFACNYGSKTCQTESGWYSDTDAIDKGCGSTKGGWYSHPSNKNSFGRTPVGNSFC